MAQIQKFVYTLIMFLSLFVMVTNGMVSTNAYIHRCIHQDDCPKYMCEISVLPECINGFCTCV
ncbi:putative Late nodulin [Medicago truncatula]|uniref:Nodule Cysteine-Rich (NCR) secreted peptide n=1 Tax=Medicago truncatula TaxID=3880 RepID=A0A072UFX8_MEDTR|nr:Nodule Cysteine-Rich (NCR) secreted peptide [Medicago truncatula]RHN55976.1 putative Late nodulin [Medicago truncatula]